jgi:hypothetical protein
MREIAFTNSAIDQERYSDFSAGLRTCNQQDWSLRDEVTTIRRATLSPLPRPSTPLWIILKRLSRAAPKRK